MAHIGVAKHIGAAVLTNIFTGVADQTVALSSDAALYLTGSGEFEAFLHTALVFSLGISVSFLDVLAKRTWQPL